ncbi:AtpZ/AtpI family protein [uncultured Jatrophihabitans sp.]|uniref:AtpZ/AtpI family protein n=1 Tax=uncultured Jatrophihabitans sp. TaxID=1610747 RepID=UPI0035CB3FDE
MPAESPGPAEWSTYLGMGAAIAGQLAVGLLLGLLVDSLAGTAPVFLLIGLFVGIVAAVAYTVSKFRELMTR